MIYHTLLFDHIRNDKCPNKVDACRVLLLFLSGSLQESMLWRTLFHSLSCAALDDFLVSFIFES